MSPLELIYKRVHDLEERVKTLETLLQSKFYIQDTTLDELLENEDEEEQ